MAAQANAALSAKRARIGPGESGMTRAILAGARADGEMIRRPSGPLAALRPAGSAANGGLGGRLLDIVSTLPASARLARRPDGSPTNAANL